MMASHGRGYVRRNGAAAAGHSLTWQYDPSTPPLPPLQSLVRRTNE